MFIRRFRFVPGWVAAAGLSLLLSCCGQQAEPPKTAAPEPEQGGEQAAGGSKDVVEDVLGRLHKGIDVSVHSGEIDWAAVAAQGHTYAFLKATEGMDLKDGAFDQHWEETKKAGLIRGAYHFYVTEDDPEAQARFFIENVHLEPGDLAPVVDVETLGHDTKLQGLAERVKVYLEVLEKHYGVKPIIYTSPNFWDERMSAEFGEYPLWVAEYGVDEPHLPKGWSGWHLWQWQGDAQIPGVEKNADLSRVNREHPDLSALVVP